MILDNSPALGWIRITNAIITYNNIIYTIANECTEKKYVYWEAERPHIFKYTNEILNQSTMRFLILINDNGRHTKITPEDKNFNVSFDSEFTAKLEHKINGIYKEFTDKDGANIQKFSAIEQNQEGIRQTVAENIQKHKSLETRVSQIKQTATEISQELKTTKQTWKDDGLRQDVVDEFLKHMTSLGTLQQVFDAVSVDGKYERDEYNSLGKAVSDLRNTGNVLVKVLRLVETKITNSSESSAFHSKLDDIDRKIKLISQVIDESTQDGKLPAGDITRVNEEIARYMTFLNSLKETTNKILTVANQGELTELMSKYFLAQHNAGFLFKEKINGIDSRMTEFKVGLESVSSKVEDYKRQTSSLIEQTADGIKLSVSGLSRKVDDTNSNVNIAMNKANNAYRNADSAISKANDAYSNADNAKEMVSRAETEIQLLKDGLRTKVSSSDVYSIIEQSPSAVRVAFNQIDSASAEFTSKGLTILKGYVATDTLTVPSGHYPVINLFTSGNDTTDLGGYPQIDATASYNSGYGHEIRFKWNDENYISVGEEYDKYGDRTYRYRHLFYIGDYSGGNSPICTINNQGMFYKDINIINAINNASHGSVITQDDLDVYGDSSGFTIKLGDKRVVFSRKGNVHLNGSGNAHFTYGYSGDLWQY